ncbi:MAG TPA: radical SAM protein [Anaeromyxobacteraceae bacterium]|nr:radical SAM protein [Anaeromyxobacteraceae bacterium]
MNGEYAWAGHRLFPGQDGGGALLFGEDQASLFAVEEEARPILERWRGRERIAFDEAPPADREVLEALRDARILVPPGHHQAPRAALDPAAFPLKTLVLEVAQSCNLRCAYCYAGGGTYGGAPRLVDAETARRAARFLVDASGDRKAVTLVLFGGEPLLNLPAMRAAVEEAEEAAARAGKVVHVSLTTNGTRFTPEALRFLRDHRVSVSVSIDGPPDVHDRNRRYAAGGGTYADVLAGLELFRAHAGRLPAARVTLTPDQWSRAEEVFLHLAGLGFVEVGIAPASPIAADLLPTREQEEALLAAFTSLAARFVDEARAGRVLPFSNVLDLLARLHRGDAKDVACGAGLGYVAVDAAGRLFLCHRLAGEAAFCLGDLDGGLDASRARACLAALASPREEACGRCWARRLCAGGCHYENHVREDRLGLPAGSSCDFIRRWLELGIRAYASLQRAAAGEVLGHLRRRADA